jgi:hypothetical protein
MSILPDMNDESGLDVQKWAKWRWNLLSTGAYDPNDWDLLNAYQKKYTNDTKNTLRAMKLDNLEESTLEESLNEE